MELKVNVVLVVILGIAWSGLTATSPSAVVHADQNPAGLAELEDAFAHDPADLALARALAGRYLELNKPGLAIATIRAGESDLLYDPVLAHRLARAYESSARVVDALATAEVALARCARSLGTANAPSGTPVPEHDCSAREHAMLDMHRAALSKMVRWGVSDPNRDHRARLAYELTVRRASLASIR